MQNLRADLTRKPATVAAAPTLSRAKIIRRLWHGAEAQLRAVEKRLSKDSGETVEFEREARTLGHLAKMLKELVALENLIAEQRLLRLKLARPDLGEGEGEGGGAEERHLAEARERPPGELDDFRKELARRLVALRGARTAPAGS